MQRCQKLETLLMEGTLAHPGTRKTAPLYQRYYLRFEGAYRANLRELERLQRLQIVQDVHFGDENAVGALHDLQLYQRFAKRNSRPAPTAPAAPENPQPQSNQQSAKRNALDWPIAGTAHGIDPYLCSRAYPAGQLVLAVPALFLALNRG